MASSTFHPTIRQQDSTALVSRNCRSDESSTIGLARRLRRMKRRLLLQAVAAEPQDMFNSDKSGSTAFHVSRPCKKGIPAVVFHHYRNEDSKQSKQKDFPDDTEDDVSMAEDDNDEASLRDEEDCSSIGNPSPTSVDRIVRYHFPTVTKNKDLMPSFDPKSSMLSLPSLVDTVSMGSSFSSSLGDSSHSWANMSSSSALRFRTSTLDDIEEYRKFGDDEHAATKPPRYS